MDSFFSVASVLRLFFRSIVGEGVFSLPTCVVSLDGLRLNGDGGVATLEELRAIGDGPYYVATLQAQSGSQRRECRNEHRNNDFDDLFTFHDDGVF